METNKLIGEHNKPDIVFTVEDLIPIKHKKKSDYMELVKLIDYSCYKHAGESFKDDYEVLYQKEENRHTDFFKIRETDVIVIPGNYIYPTILEEKDIY